MGFALVIKTENTEIELQKKLDRSLPTTLYWTNRHRNPFSVGNPAEPKIRQLISMVNNIMTAFDVPFKEQYGAQIWCVDVKNMDSSKKLNWRCLIENREGNTQDISIFISYLWEPIWYFNKCKAPEYYWQSSRWMGFAHSTVYEIWNYINTEHKNPKYLNRSVIHTWRRHIGTYK